MTTVVAVIALIEFFGVGTLGSFNVAIELGRAWRQHEEPDAALLAGGLEAGGNFAAAVDLNGPNGKGGMRCCRWVRNSVAHVAVACR